MSDLDSRTFSREKGSDRSSGSTPAGAGEGQVSGKVTGRRGRKWEERRGDIRRGKERAARKGRRTKEIKT